MDEPFSRWTFFTAQDCGPELLPLVDQRTSRPGMLIVIPTKSKRRSSWRPYFVLGMPTRASARR